LLLAVALAPTPVQAQNTDVIDYNAPKRYEIGGITVSGIEFLDEKTLVKLSGLQVGDMIEVPGEQIPKAIKALWRQNLFSDVKIVASKMIEEVIFLEFQLTERARLSKYRFKGLRKTEEDELRDKIELIRGRIITDFLVNNTKNVIANYFRDKGYLNVETTVTNEKDPDFDNSNVLILDVHKGKKVKINEIVFNGNSELLSRKLKKKMENTKERSSLNLNAPGVIWKDLKKAKLAQTLGNLSMPQALQYVSENIIRFTPFNSSKYLVDDFYMDKSAIINFYNEKGYRDARITSDTLYFVDNQNVTIELNIDEGNRYYYRHIDWKGNSKYTDEALGGLLGIKRGDVYDKTKLETRLFIDPSETDISSLYMNDGYLFFNVTPIEKAIVGDSIDLVISVYEGPQATIRNINIQGNTKTNEHVIRRELRTIPGNKFSRSDIIRSQRELAGLGYFDPEQIGITPKPNPQEGTVDIDYELTEKSSDQLELSAGWGANTVVGSIGVAFNNFSLKNVFDKEAWKPLPAGDGQRLSLRYQATGPAFRSLNFSFTEPWLGGRRPNALSVSVYSTQSFNNFWSVRDIDSPLASVLRITGGSVGLGRRLRWPDDNFVLQQSLNYQFFDLKNWLSDFIISDGNAHNLSLTTTLSRYSIDQPIYPRSGSNISLSLQITPPYSAFNDKDYSTLYNNKKYKWAEYHKWKFVADWYTAIVGDLVVRTRAKMGLTGFYNEDIGYSPFERFEVGDDGIANFSLYGKELIALRGYETITDNAVPRQVISMDDKGNEVVTQSGLSRVGDPFYAKYTVELRYPLTLNPSSTIYALAFVEGGNSWNTFKDFDPFDLRRAAGLGVRIFLPMFGTLGFDYGIGFDKFIETPTNSWEQITNRGKFSVILGVEPE
ncbi:MAG: BamA/OMP85 family outer membrane protein, partial [Chitinophagales bacterium]